MDWDTTKNGKGEQQHNRGGLSRFSTGSHGDKRRAESKLLSSEDRLVIPAGSRKEALVHLALEAWRVGLLHSRALGQVRGREVDEDGLQRALYRSSITEVEELRLEDEKHYVDMTPVVFVFAALAMAVRYISLGLDDQSLYILAGISFALMYGLRPFFSKLQRPKD